MLQLFDLVLQNNIFCLRLLLLTGEQVILWLQAIHQLCLSLFRQSQLDVVHFSLLLFTRFKRHLLLQHGNTLPLLGIDLPLMVQLCFQRVPFYLQVMLIIYELGHRYIIQSQQLILVWLYIDEFPVFLVVERCWTHNLLGRGLSLFEHWWALQVPRWSNWSVRTLWGISDLFDLKSVPSWSRAARAT